MISHFKSFIRTDPILYITRFAETKLTHKLTAQPWKKIPVYAVFCFRSSLSKCRAFSHNYRPPSKFRLAPALAKLCLPASKTAVLTMSVVPTLSSCWMAPSAS